VTSISEYDKEKPRNPASRTNLIVHTGGGKGSRDPNAMEIDASKQDKGKEKKTRFTYLQSMKGRCFGCDLRIIRRKKAITTEIL